MTAKLFRLASAILLVTLSASCATYYSSADEWRKNPELDPDRRKTKNLDGSERTNPLIVPGYRTPNVGETAPGDLTENCPAGPDSNLTVPCRPKGKKP